MSKSVSWKLDVVRLRDRVSGVVSLDLEKPLKVNYADLRLSFCGETKWIKEWTVSHSGGGASRGASSSGTKTYTAHYTENKQKWEASAKLEAQETVLQPGHHEYPFSFKLDHELNTASFPRVVGFFYSPLLLESRNRGPEIEARWELFLHIDIPWAIDIREHLALEMPPPRCLNFKSKALTPKTLTDTLELLADKKMELEVVLPKRIFSPGEKFMFCVQFKNNSSKKVTGLKAQLYAFFPKLVGCEGRLLDEWTSLRASRVFSYKIPGTSAGEGENINGEFECIMPTLVGYTTENSLFHAKYIFRLVVDLPWATDPYVQGRITLVPEIDINTFIAHQRSPSAAAAADPAQLAATPSPSTPGAPVGPGEGVGTTHDGTTPGEPPARKFSSFVITILRGIGISAQGSSSASDPYVQLDIGGHVFKTEVRKRSMHPQWDQSFVYSNPDLRTPLRFRVLDWNLVTRDELLSEASLDVSGVQPGVTLFDVPLQGGQGTLQISVTATV